ncbi:hypothetical protein CENSYa_1110 [Cenarchaeum symbiosum A]|uniref:Uncharacterized protein n=1 Tax=Cenarchaeum symbiosum (strain A) TaxID=414004 RepID=A0RWM2_CENSY|nr:hypothetical protein CENSYa_1110 [Cenarchaeum symbiosum A]
MRCLFQSLVNKAQLCTRQSGAVGYAGWTRTNPGDYPQKLKAAGRLKLDASCKRAQWTGPAMDDLKPGRTVEPA